MPEASKVMILEDEPDMREALVRAFKEKTFTVESADSPEACIKNGFDAKSFDVYVVDLELEPNVRPFFGNNLLAIRKFEVSNSLFVVYSCHSRPEYIIKAIREGAADFILKTECPPDKVPERIVKLMEERRRETEQFQQLSDLIAENRERWQREYAGQVIALVNGEPVLAQRTRLRALVAYRTSLQEHPEWPKEPLLLEITHPGEEST